MKYIYLALISIIAVSCSKHTGVVIDFAELKDGKVEIIYQDPDMIQARDYERVAVSELKDGRCEINFDTLQFDGKRKECTFTVFNEEKRIQATLPMIIEKGKTIVHTINGLDDYVQGKQMINITYKGSKFAEDFSVFWQGIKESFIMLAEYSENTSLLEKQVVAYKDFIKKYPESGYAYSILIGQLQTITNEDSPIMKYCSELSNDKSDNVWHKYLTEAYKYKEIKRATSSTLVLTAQNLQGDTLTERDIKGEMILVDFWATWCKPCLNSLPKLEELYKNYKDKGLTIVSVCIGTPVNDWLEFSEKNPFAWQSLFADGQELTQRYDFNAIPFVLLADKDGKVLKRGITLNEAEDIISKHLTK